MLNFCLQPWFIQVIFIGRYVVKILYKPSHIFIKFTLENFWITIIIPKVKCSRQYLVFLYLYLKKYIRFDHTVVVDVF
jgi:2-polyprenyl-3-methyl-5-hydroxy-6-metoxy-1,4-benzoquinol methylase